MFRMISGQYWVEYPKMFTWYFDSTLAKFLIFDKGKVI